MSAIELCQTVGHAVQARVASARGLVEHAVNELGEKIVSAAMRLGVGVDDEPPIPEARVVHETHHD
ncbi:MAG TPA: hypothetical protein VGM90_11460 [Kofleriaceae bacterium]|jgi:hypothetical protein